MKPDVHRKVIHLMASRGVSYAQACRELGRRGAERKAAKSKAARVHAERLERMVNR